MSDVSAAAPGLALGRWGLISLLAAVLTLLVGLWAALRLGDVGPQVGRPAPAFELNTFDGSTVKLADLRGKVVVVNFWASWCVECALEADELEQLWRARRDLGLVILGVGYTDTEPAARDYLKRFDITYPNGPDRGARISRAYGLSGVPETVLIDREGNIAGLPIGAAAEAAKLVGAVGGNGLLSIEALTARIDSLLAAAP